MKRIEILYEDDSCLILNKPAGLAVQGGKGVTVSLDSILAENWPARPLLVHRLDKDTSGVILTAKTREAAARFSRLLGEGQSGGGILKQYRAICGGRPAEPSGVIHLELAIHGAMKKAETRCKTLETVSLENFQFSLLELELGTGRMHQIRRHLAMTGNPILGDDKYGDFDLNKTLRKTMRLKRLLLHACRLVIPRYAGAAPLDVSAPLPDYFSAFWESAGQAL